MFKQIGKINDVHNLSVKYDIIVFTSKDIRQYFINTLEKSEVKFYYFGENGYIILKENDTIFLENKVLNTRSQVPYAYSGATISSNGGVFTKNKNYDSKGFLIQDFYFHNFKTNEEVLLIEQGVGYFAINYDNNTKSIFRSLNKLSGYSLHTGTTHWETNLSEAGVIRKIIGISGDNLWVSVNHIVEAEHSWLEKRTYKLVVLDIHTGAVKKVIDHDYRFADFWVVYLEEKGTILSLQGHHNIANRRETSTIYEYDANTTSVLRAFEVPALAEVPLSIREYRFFENKIYFTASDGTVIVPNCIGVMDYQTLELLWYKKLGHSATRIEVTDNKIYFMNQNTDLYIYEREDPNNQQPSPKNTQTDDTTI